MRRSLNSLAFLLLVAVPVAGADTGPTGPAPSVPSYHARIQPLFDSKCVACHACNDAPCQLNLGSAEGVRRGASKLKVYDSRRTRRQAPTRLFTDAASTPEWRQLGFFPVLEGGADKSLMGRMLALGRERRFAPNSRLPDDIPVGINASYQCAANATEMKTLARKSPHLGMPLGTTGLSDAEHDLLQRWLAAGAPVDAAPVVASAAEAGQIADWEAFLNTSDNRGRLLARWLYEHLFLAHLYFPDASGGHFFELVRSRTPPGQAIVAIATAQPNEAPGPGGLYYRLRPLQGAIVHKTHITLALDAGKLARLRQDFLASDWRVDTLPGYDAAARANPFATFAPLPTRARYRFMLENAEYFVRSFIRGPVCRGNIATDVIHDHFWVFFQAPESDLYVTSAAHRARTTPLLAMPGQKNGMGDLLAEWTRHSRLRDRYSEVRAHDYAAARPEGAGLADLWNGDGHNRNALLTVVRHQDSASVTPGLQGDVPQTLWWLDYPLFELTYYSLVANFNVFDTVSHQAQTRLFFDLIRFGAESNFLRLMPADARQALLDDWYQSSGRLKVRLYYPKTDTRQPSGISYQGSDARTEFAGLLMGKLSAVNTPDPINQCSNGLACFRPQAPLWLHMPDHALGRLTRVPAAQLPVVNLLPEATLLRVHATDGRRQLYTLLRHRAHSNVAWMAGESLRFLPEQDRLMLFPGLLTSYPNFAFDLPVEQVPEFSDTLLAVRHAADLDKVVQRWGVRRTHPRFWDFFDDLTAWQKEADPREAGILDLNRWENL